MNRTKLTLTAAVLGVVAGLLPQRSFAAEDFKVELSGYWGVDSHFPSLSGALANDTQILGSSLGVQASVTSGSNFKWAAGGGAAIPLTRSFLLTGEFGYEQMGNANIALAAGATQAAVSARLRFTQFLGGVQYLIGDKDRGVVPFVSAGFGAARQTLSADASGLGESTSASQTVATEYFGGGVRLKLGTSWGIRPEFRMVHVPIESTLGVPGSWYMRGSVGVYWQFGGDRR